MSQARFPFPIDQPGGSCSAFAVTGASVGTTAGSAGLDGRGAYACTILKGTGGTANQVTITWLYPFAEAPYVFFWPKTANCLVQLVSQTASTLVINTVNASDGTTGVNNADLNIFVAGFNTTNYVS